MVETLGIGTGSGSRRWRTPSPSSRGTSDGERERGSGRGASSSRERERDGDGGRGPLASGESVEGDDLLRNADCVWDGGGSGDPSYYIELCTSYSETECISSRNGFLDGRCVWLGGHRLDDEETPDVVDRELSAAAAASAQTVSRRASQPRQQRAAPRPSRSKVSKRSHRGPRAASQRMAAVLNFESVEAVDQRPFTLDLRMALGFGALTALMALAVHRVCGQCRRTHSEGAKTREHDHSEYALLP